MSSFRKRTPGTGPTGAGGAAAAATAAPRGTRVSGFNGRTTVSSGIASLDSSIGDLLVGTVTVVERDRGSGYSSLVLKYFCAQGLAAAHVLCLASTDDPEAFVRTLMKVAKDDDDDSQQNDPDDADDAPLTQPGPRTLGSLRDTTRLNIAWRYQNMPTLNAAQQKASSASLKGLGPYCSQFDITKQMDEATLNTASIALVNVNEWVQLTSKQLYQNLYSAIVGIIQKGSFKNSDSNSAPTILRIAIDDIGGPTWGSDAGSPTSIHALIWFLSKLRLLVRESRAIVMCTLSSFLYSNHLVGVSTNPYVSLIRHAVDTVLEVESFSGSKRIFSDHFTSDYHGFLHVHKLPTINTLTSAAASKMSAGELHSLAFKARRKRFLVEPFRLPPEKEDEKPDDAGKTVSKGIGVTSGCGTVGHNHGSAVTTNSKLDF